MTRTRRPFVRAALFSFAMSFPAILVAPAPTVAQSAMGRASAHVQAQRWSEAGSAHRVIVAGDSTLAPARHRPVRVFHEGGADQASPEPVLQQEANSEPCLHDEAARQLDFWVGTWDVYNREGQQVGVNEVERLLKGCLLLENWTGAGGSSGKSMNYFDPLRQVFEASGDGGEAWDTTWVGIYVRRAAGEAGRASDDAGSGGLDGAR